MQTQIRVMTYNIAGGRDLETASREELSRVISAINPDILALQEAWKIEDEDGREYDIVKAISTDLGNFSAHFCPTLSMSEHFHVRKDILVDGVFNDWKNWSLGNGLISRWSFTRLANPQLPSSPVNIPIYRPQVYEGTRDTDPRSVILSRINLGTIKPFILVCHLTTLSGERRGSTPAIQGKTEEAQILRWRQAKMIVDLIQRHILDKNEVAILMGDFNAIASEPCLQDVLLGEAGFIRLLPNRELPTHPKAPAPIDHILIFPGNCHFDYQCWVEDDAHLGKISDHLPVIADITFDF